MSIPSINPIRSQIRDAVLYALRNRIIGGGIAIRYSSEGNTTVSDAGYYHTIRHAFDPPRTFEQMQEFPCANVYIDAESCENAANVQIDQNQAALHNSFTLVMEICINETNNPALIQDQILADIQKYFGINYFIPDSAGNATCFNCYYLSSDPWGTDRTRPNCGITVNYIVWYRQKLTDPTQKI